MTTLLVDNRLLRAFERRVVPVLGCRAIVSHGSPAAFLQRLVADRPRLWVATVHRPLPGVTGTVRFRRYRPTSFYEARVWLPDAPEDLEGERLVCVQRVFGMTASCALVPDGVPSQASGAEPQPHFLLAISCRDITLIADVMPGKDCLVAVDVWANEVLPMHLLVQRPNRMWLAPAHIDPQFILPDGVGFAIGCPRCEGSGRVTCVKCEGDGTIECRKCGGSGNYIGKYGDRMGDCHACEGRGSLECSNCAGEGTVECRKCVGIGRLPARFSIVDGTCRAQGEILNHTETSLFDWERREELTIRANAQALLQETLEQTSEGRQCDPARQFQLQQHCLQFQGLATCLRRSMEAQGILDANPIWIDNPRSSTRRSPGGVVYEFRVANGRKLPWVQEGLLPLPAMAPLKFLNGDKMAHRDIDLPYQDNGTRSGVRPTPFLLDCEGKGNGYRLLIRFPAEIDTSRMPNDVAIKADAATPAEATQMRHLFRWCAWDNRAHPVLGAVVFPNGNSDAMPTVSLFDSAVSRYPKQFRAVQLGVSDHPLALIKGPPGTGKTTVITETVRQLVAQGKKVLVCSQTHQAVRNVLERLHRAGGFRMARHVSEKKRDGLSSIELAYVAGGVEDSFYRSVLTSAQSRVQEMEKRLTFLKEGLSVVPLALAAAIELDTHRRRTAEALRALGASLTADTKRAAQALADGVGAVERKERLAVDEASTRLTATDHSSHVIQEQIEHLDGTISNVEAAYLLRTGRKPEDTAAPDSWLLRLRDSVLPDWMVGAAALQERYAKFSQRAIAARAEHSRLSSEIAALTAHIEGLHADRKKQEAELRDVHAKTLAQLQDRHGHETKRLTHELHQVEVSLSEVQGSAAPFAADLNIAISADAGPAVWQACLDKLTVEHANKTERHGFVQAWARDIEADPQAVLACYWENIQVFFSTCVGVASWRRLVDRGRESIDLVIIDEAAHATATETLVPMLYAKRVLLIGDEMQLPPILTQEVGDCAKCPRLDGDEAPVVVASGAGIAGAVRMSDCWLERSFFEWLWRLKADLPRVVLDTQFRMHHSIADFVGSVFYPEGLTTGVDDADRQLAFGEFTRPVCLIPTSAYADRQEEFLDPGYRNVLEAKIIRRVLERAEADLSSPYEFGIITPYAHQVKAISEMLDTLMPLDNKVRLLASDIASVDSFQGSERDIIIVSFVRSPRDCDRCQGGKNRRKEDGARCRNCQGRGYLGTGLSFARDLRRLNVAFSRAKRMLILVGDIAALTDRRFRGGAAGSDVLKMFENYVADHGKVLHVWERGHAG